MLQPNKGKKNWEADKAWLQNWYKNRKLSDPTLNQNYQAEKGVFIDRANSLPEPNYYDKIDKYNTQGEFIKDTGEIKMLNTAGPSVYTHEGSHAVNSAATQTKSSWDAFRSIQDNVKPIESIEDEWVKKNYKDISNYDEVIGRLNSYRQINNFQPDQVITPELIKSNRDAYGKDPALFEDNTDQLYKMFEDDGLSKVLNSVVLNDTQNTNTQIAKYGGKIKDMKKGKKLKKHAFGDYVENPQEALYENQKSIIKAQLEGNSNGWAQGLQMFGSLAQMGGSAMMSSPGAATSTPSGAAPATTGFGGAINGFVGKNSGNIQGGMNVLSGIARKAFGGPVNNAEVEVEGNEVGETPGGKLLDFKGPSHENNGIPVSLPEGTEIYSKRIKVDGVTMADRKKKREKKLSSLESLFDKSSGDLLLKNSLKRTKLVSEKEEASDKQIQDQVRAEIEAEDQGINPTEMHKYGNTVGEEPFQSYLTPQGTTGMGIMPIDLNMHNNFVPGEEQDPEDTFSFNNLLGGVTFGDALGMVGTLDSAFSPGKNTEENRAGDAPNTNAFENYGQEGLESLQGSKRFLDQIKMNKMKQLALARSGSVKRNNNSARGINTQRALNLATDAQINSEQGNIQEAYASGMVGIQNQEASFLNMMDAKVMQGAAGKEIADKQDRDAYYTQRGVDIANRGTGLQEASYDINKMKESKVKGQALNNLSDLVDIDPNTGIMTMKKGAKLTGNTPDVNMGSGDPTYEEFLKYLESTKKKK